VGWDNAILLEPTSSHENSLKTRRIPRRMHAMAVIFIPELNSVINISHGKINIWLEMFLPKNAS
jgi:hypothetical protein